MLRVVGSTFFGWLRAKQHGGCNKRFLTCRWLESSFEGRLELVKEGNKVAWWWFATYNIEFVAATVEST